jgi:transcriptional regulator with XRE-family HTH domain
MGLTKIKLLRLQSGLLQWQLAKMVGVPESYLSKIETGRIQPSERLLRKIASALEVKPTILKEGK